MYQWMLGLRRKGRASEKAEFLITDVEMLGKFGDGRMNKLSSDLFFSRIISQVSGRWKECITFEKKREGFKIDILEKERVN